MSDQTHEAYACLDPVLALVIGDQLSAAGHEVYVFTEDRDNPTFSLYTFEPDRMDRQIPSLYQSGGRQLIEWMIDQDPEPTPPAVSDIPPWLSGPATIQ